MVSLLKMVLITVGFSTIEGMFFLINNAADNN